MESGVRLYYTIAVFIDNNPSMCDTAWERFLSLCLEALGQVFIRENPEQQSCDALIEFLISSIKSNHVQRIISADFVPSVHNSSKILQKIAKAIGEQKISPDFAFTLLSKFDLRHWQLDLTELSPILENSLLCLSNALKVEDYRDHFLIDFLIENLICQCVAYDFPSMVFDALAILCEHIEKHKPTELPVKFWTNILKSLSGLGDLENELSTDSLLSLQILDKLLNYMVQVFGKQYKNEDSWNLAIGHLSLLVCKFYKLAIDRAVSVAKATNSTQSSFDMFKLLWQLYEPLVVVKVLENKRQAFQPALKPCFTHFGLCLRKLHEASLLVEFTNLSNFFSALLQIYTENLMEHCASSPIYGTEVHKSLEALDFSLMVPENQGQIELLEVLCARDGISKFWTSVVCSVNWDFVSQSRNFNSDSAKEQLISSLFRLAFNSSMRFTRNSDLGHQVAYFLFESLPKLKGELELLPLETYTSICQEVRNSNRPLPPQIVFAWASENQMELQGLKDCLVLLENCSGAFYEDEQLSERQILRGCEFIQLINNLIFDCLASEIGNKTKQQQDVLLKQLSIAVFAVLKRSEIVLHRANGGPLFSFSVKSICGTTLEAFNMSLAHSTRILPYYYQYFSSAEAKHEFLVHWLSQSCRKVTSTLVSLQLAENLLSNYIRFSPGFSWETVQSVVSFSVLQQQPQQPSAPTIQFHAGTGVSMQPTAQTSKFQEVDELTTYGPIAASNRCLFIVQALARRAFQKADQQNFELQKTVLLTYTDILLKTGEKPAAGDETRFLGLFSLWLRNMSKLEQFLAEKGIDEGQGRNSLVLDLTFVTRLTSIVNLLVRLGETRSSKGLLGAIGFGSKSQLPQWFHVFVRTLALLLTRFYPDCLKSPMKLTGKQLFEMLTSLKQDRDYADTTPLINASISIFQNLSLTFQQAIDQLLAEYRCYSC